MASIYASVAIIRRNSAIVFRPPRKERPTDITQARKAAQRHWNATLKEGDVLEKVVLVREFDGRLEVSERARNAGKENPWVKFFLSAEVTDNAAHIVACIKELGLNSYSIFPAIPDTLIINGITYRREL
jgi:hypothetical protein